MRARRGRKRAISGVSDGMGSANSSRGAGYSSGKRSRSKRLRPKGSLCFFPKIAVYTRSMMSMLEFSSLSADNVRGRRMVGTIEQEYVLFGDVNRAENVQTCSAG